MFRGSLAGLVDENPDSIGYAFAINGQINSADIYASHELFAKLWPKLLKASATEAVAEWKDAIQTDQVSVQETQAFLDRADAGASLEREATSRIKLVTKETSDDIVFETHDASTETAIHKSFVRKH